jgi:hypothetical protein
MQKREETRTRHPDAMYAKITLPGEHHGEHHFKIPSPLTGARLLKLRMIEDEEDQFRATGAIIGSAWHHEKWDLESLNAGDMLAFGEDVFEELHDAGYRFEWMLLISSIIITEIGKLAAINKEVRDRLGFSKVKKAKRASTNSKSRKRISATPSPTTA